MARPLKPLVRGGGYYPSRKWTPLVYPGGYTTANGGEQPEPEAVLKTVTGSLIHITDALALPAEALSVNVEPIQDLHGYDSPWPAGGGKNLFDASLYPTTTKNGVTCTNNGDGSFTLNGTATADIFFDVFSAQFKESSGGTPLPTDSYRLTGCPSGGSSNTYNIYIIPSYAQDNGSGANANTTVAGGSIYIKSGYTCNNLVFWPMIRISTNGDDTFAPYSNICPISGHTDADVTRTGKNLCGDIAIPQIASNSNRVVNPVYLKAGQYTISISGRSAATAIYIRKGEDITFAGDAYAFKYNANVFTFTADEDGYYYAQLYRGSTTPTWEDEPITHAWLELGSTATAYEPYQGNTYTIQLGDTVYGGTLDVTGGKMVVDSAYSVLNDPDKWIEGSGAFNLRYDVPFADRKIYDNSYSGLICSYVPCVYGTEPYGRWNSASGEYFCIKSSTLTLEQVQADAVAGKIAIVYEIATPIEITLTPTQIDTLLGENNLWADAGDSTLTYYAEGNASTSEALGILLGGTYNNPGGADDVSDDEALGILLGGS